MLVRRRASGRAHYNYFRDYDPAKGGYIESDPIGLNGGVNSYLYAEASPIGFADPFGLQAVLPWIGPRVAPIVRPGTGFYPIDPVFPIVIPSERDVADCEEGCHKQWDRDIYWCEVMWKMRGRPKGGWSACKREADKQLVQCDQECDKYLAHCPVPAVVPPATLASLE